MNLALHGFLLQVFVSILDFQHGSLLCSAGEPGYLDFDNLPETNFSCQGKVIGGYYADVEAGCQMFHVCTIGQKDEIMDIKFLCLNGTVFDQETRVCERVDEVDCSKSERFYNLNLELYGNNAVTLSLHETSEHVDIPLDSLDDHQQRTTSARPITTTSTTTTTSKPSKLATTPSSSSFSHPTGYPQHYQPQPPFPQVHTSQSKSLFDDKNGGYHHQYIFHNGERNNNQATSYQLFSNQGVSSTTIQAPQVHQIRFSSTASPQIIHNEPSTVAPLFHATSSTIQTLLNSNANSPALINPIFHNHGIASTTEQFSIHSSNPRDTSEYRDNGEQGIRPLEAVQSTNKGKVSKLTISPVPSPPEVSRIVQTKTSQSSQQQRIPGNFLPTPATVETTIRSFYPTPRTSKPTQSNDQVTQHIHVLPPVQIPQLKPQQITINLPPPDIQRIVQNPPPLLSSQSRVIVTAKASVSDESGRSLNTTQLVTLPLPTIPASYDDYKEGDETFDPFYRDVPKIRNNRRNAKEANGTKSQRSKRSLEERRSPMETFVYGVDPGKGESSEITEDKRKREERKVDDDAKTLKQSLLKFRDILFSGEINDDSIRDVLRASESRMRKKFGKIQEKVGDLSWEDLEARASKHLETRYEDSEEESEDAEKSEKDESLDESNMEEHSAEGHVDDGEKENDEVVEVEEKEEVDDADSEDKMEDLEKNEDYLDKKEDPDAVSDVEDKQLDEKKDEEHPEDERVLDIVILDTEEYQKLKSTGKPSDDTSESKENAFTELPIISTSEESKPEETPVASEDDDLDKVAEDVETTKNIEASTESINLSSTVAIEEEMLKKEEPQEMKTTTRRKSSRIRQPKGRISAKKKQPKENVEVEKEETKEQKISTNDSHIQRITEQIFDEPESQTSKEVDTRAVDEKSNYKSLKEGKDEDAGKNTLRGETNEFRPVERHPNNLEKQEKSSEKIYSLEDTESLETPGEEEESEKSGEKMESVEEDEHSVEVTEENVSSEEKKYYKEEASIEEIVDDESSTIASQEFKDESEETLEKESLHKMKSSRRGKSMKFEDSSKESLSHREDKSLKFKSEEETESKEHSTISSIEEIASEEVSAEYHDSTETSLENIREISDEDDYEDPGSQEDTTMSIENNDSAESSASREKTLEEITEDESADDEDSTEGVLKFTDELPKEKHEETTETKKSTESVENIAQDYVDDNYEPENYKEREPTDTNNLSDEKQKEALDKEKKLADGAAVTALPENVDEKVEIKDENVDEKIEMKVENVDEKVETEAEKAEEDKDSDKEEEPSTTMPTTSTTTTTVPTTTTTMRPTPPKLFKPIAVRKVYNYIPPTTSPNPVIIKPRLSLLNPKPAKPYKSYNDLAPKPVIRKFPLLTRKTTTTMSTTTMDDEAMETTTEAMIVTTEVGRSEENILEGKLETKEEPVTTRLLENSNKNKNDQLPSPSEHTSPSNLRKEENSKQDPQNFTPYPITKLTTLASVVEKALEKAESTTKEPESSTGKSFTFMDLDVISTTVTSVYDMSTKANFGESSGNKITEEESTTMEEEQTTVIPLESTTILETTSRLNVERPEAERSTESTTQRPLNRKSSSWKKQGSFNCLEKEMYRFYGDTRDCRLFHYCSPGFTSRQVLDFRFVCEEGTAFDEESQSCQHDVRNRICPDKQW